jgi:hypothetical protein
MGLKGLSACVWHLVDLAYAPSLLTLRLLQYSEFQECQGMPKQVLSTDKSRFINEMASLLMPLGMPRVVARLYSYLLIKATPVSLDQIVAELEISKSSVSVAARVLEKHSLAHRHGEPGSKRALYEASNAYAGVLLEQITLLGSLGRLLQNRGPAVASGVALKRLRDLARFYESMRDAVEGVQASIVAGNKKS